MTTYAVGYVVTDAHNVESGIGDRIVSCNQGFSTRVAQEVSFGVGFNGYIAAVLLRLEFVLKALVVYLFGRSSYFGLKTSTARLSQSIRPDWGWAPDSGIHGFGGVRVTINFHAALEVSEFGHSPVSSFLDHITRLCMIIGSSTLVTLVRYE
jgi:hypothetical protein